MSAWLVFSMMGFYPVCPASGEYVLTTPAFEEIRIVLTGSEEFIIRAPGTDSKRSYIRSVTRNGKRHRSNIISHSDITSASEFVFRISEKP